MCNSNLHYNVIQKGAGKNEDSEESEVSRQGTESSQHESSLLPHQSWLGMRKPRLTKLMHAPVLGLSAHFVSPPLGCHTSFLPASSQAYTTLLRCS